MTVSHPTAATAFDLVAEQHWQDYLQNLPVAGGMAYESRVRACGLDESMDSLKRLDALLALIKSELSDQTPSVLMKQSSFRHFLLFLGFYAGRVVSKNTRVRLSWQDFGTLQQWFGVSPSFYTTTALCVDKDTPPFFVLGVILGAVFGRTPPNPLSQAPLPTSLYWAVLAYLDTLAVPAEPAPAVMPHKPIAQQPVMTADAPTKPMLVQADKPNPQTPLQNSPQTAVQTQPTKPSNPKTQAPSPSLVSQSRRAAQKEAAKRLQFLNHFKEVKHDLKTLPATNAIHNEHYQKCALVLDAVFDAIGDNMQAWQELPPAQKQTLAKAQDLLKKLAKAGNGNAQLLLSVCLFCGVGVAQNGALALKLVQAAAETGDVRAAKFLSRIYYHGLFVNPSTKLGEEWLDKAAMGGHAEAQKLKEQFAYISALKEETLVNAQKDKQFNFMLMSVAAVFILAFWLIAKFLA